MPIYSSIASTLARQGPKTITHGYAQSLVAATHPQAYVSSNRPGFGFSRRPSKLGHNPAYQFQNAFVSSAQSSRTLTQIPNEKHDRPAEARPLDAYYEAWRKHHAAGAPDKEWTQFQFAKRIEWKPLELEVDSEGVAQVETKRDRTLERVYSESAVDDIKKSVEFSAEESAALARINAAIEEEIKLRNEQAIQEETTSTSAYESSASVEAATDRSTSTGATSVYATNSELQSQSYADHLTKLSEGRRYAEIPAVFEAMLVAGIQPVTAAYNALLDAAIHLPAERIQVVPKALDVYSDMLRRKVAPNTTTYNTLMTILSSRSLEISSLKHSLEEKRIRFGGMEEPGKFMFASSELDFHILAEDDRLDLAVRLFEDSTSSQKDRAFPPETYHQLISACSEAGRVPDMIKLYEHMESHKIVPLAGTFPPMIKGFSQIGDLSSAVECYNEYKELAVAHDQGMLILNDRQDAKIYASVIKAYVVSDRMNGAQQFFGRIGQEYPPESVALKEFIIADGFVQGLLDRGQFSEALAWADNITGPLKGAAMSNVATVAADKGDKATAAIAFAHVPANYHDMATPAMAMLALSVRDGDVPAAQRFWQILSNPEISASAAFIEPAAMFAVALIGSGQVAEGLNQSEQMFARIRSSVTGNTHLQDEIDEGIEFIHRFMSSHGIVDPRHAIPESHAYPPTAFAPSAYPNAPLYEDTFDPYAASTDFKGSALIADELEKGNGGRQKVSRLNEALARFRNMRRAGRHPRYITYAKLISAAAREERMNLVHDILGMARADVPLLVQYPVVRYGWVSILDAMVGACLTLGNRTLAAQYHQELLDMGAAPTANTFGLYITTLKESTKTFDEATEAVKIFHRAKTEGVEPSSFLYNALIGKLGKARRIDDCLFYFAEMRALGIRPTSVTYGTIVNALCRVSDEKFAEELFEEMESMPNYKARPAPYNSLMQFFLTTKRDKAKVLAYYERMKSKGIQPTNHTYKLLVDTHATLEPINMAAAEAVLDVIRSTGQRPEAVHYSSLIHAKGCVMHDMEGARSVFDSVMADRSIRPQACLYQALFESMVANHRVSETEPILEEMARRGVDMTPYIANTLIHGWANEKNIEKSKAVYGTVGREKREPSTYEAMTRAYLAVEDRASAKSVVQEMLGRGYPGAVSNKILELLGGGHTESVV